jgi:hypothetical protein
MGGFIMLRGKGESFSKIMDLLEMKENKMATNTCMKTGIISA